MNTQLENDPLDRQAPDEPRFVLLGRDITSADLVRLWLALRKKDAGLVDAIVKRLKDTMEQLVYNPSKTPAHILSAQDVANRMDLWLADVNAPPPQPAPEVSDAAPHKERTDYENMQPTDSGALGEAARLQAIKDTRPPREPSDDM